jgi:hypothetical protein
MHGSVLSGGSTLTLGLLRHKEGDADWLLDSHPRRSTERAVSCDQMAHSHQDQSLVHDRDHRATGTKTAAKCNIRAARHRLYTTAKSSDLHQ